MSTRPPDPGMGNAKAIVAGNGAPIPGGLTDAPLTGGPGPNGAPMPSRRSADTSYSCYRYALEAWVPRTGILKEALKIDPSQDQRESADAVSRALPDSPGGALLRLPDGRQITLPASLTELLRVSAEELAKGHALTVLPPEAILTPPKPRTSSGCRGPSSLASSTTARSNPMSSPEAATAGSASPT